jgi:hypothetical protein
MSQTTGAELFIASEGRKDPGAMVEEFIGEKVRVSTVISSQS